MVDLQPGHDGLSIEYLMFAGVLLHAAMKFCQFMFLLAQRIDENFAVPFVKYKIGDLFDKCNYRPISLAIVLAKVLDDVLY